MSLLKNVEPAKSGTVGELLQQLLVLYLHSKTRHPQVYVQVGKDPHSCRAIRHVYNLDGATIIQVDE